MICTKFDKEPSSSIEEAKNVRSNLETDGWADRWRTTGDKEKLTLTFGLSELTKLHLRMIIENIKYVGLLWFLWQWRIIFHKSICMKTFYFWWLAKEKNWEETPGINNLLLQKHHQVEHI